MKVTISFKATQTFEVDDEYLELIKDEDLNSFNTWADSDYDNIERPMNHLEDVDWKITNKKVKIEE